jgi:hypothetical protein
MENMNSLKSIVNGSHCKLHLLSWKDEILGRYMEQMIEQAAPAEVVLLSNPPDYVKVLSAGVTTWNASDSLLGAEAFVIPVPLSKQSLRSRFLIKIFLTEVQQLSLELQLPTTNCKARLLIISFLVSIREDVSLRLILCHCLWGFHESVNQSTYAFYHLLQGLV